MLRNAGERETRNARSRSGVGTGTGTEASDHEGIDCERISPSRRASPSGVRMLSSARKIRSASFCGGGGTGRRDSRSSASTKPISGSQIMRRLRADGAGTSTTSLGSGKSRLPSTEAVGAGAADVDAVVVEPTVSPASDDGCVGPRFRLPHLLRAGVARPVAVALARKGVRYDGRCGVCVALTRAVIGVRCVCSAPTRKGRGSERGM